MEDHRDVQCARPLHPGRAPLRIPTAAALLAITAACNQADTVVDGILTPEVTGTATVPFSESDEVSLLADERTACVIDSYEVRVRCVDTEGAVVGIFGREGEGPEEFGRPGRLARGEEGTVGVQDSELGRFTVFEPSGVYVTEVSTVGVSLFLAAPVLRRGPFGCVGGPHGDARPRSLPVRS